MERSEGIVMQWHELIYSFKEQEVNTKQK